MNGDKPILEPATPPHFSPGELLPLARASPPRGPVPEDDRICWIVD